MKMYYVTTFGDISIEQTEDKEIKLTTSNLTYGERRLVREILKEYKIDTKEDAEIENGSFVIAEKTAGKTIEDVHKFMKKKLKKNKATITALKFKDGSIEISEEIKQEAETGAIVEKPSRGCPMPVAIAGEIRASVVLKEFLSDKQNDDFEKHLQFVSKGNYTGIPYLITSRWTKSVEKWGQVYDTVNKKTICANCMELPPSEEMLSLKLMIEHKEKEFIGYAI
jgi:hypothetical protein